MLKEFESVVRQKDSSQEEVLRAFFGVTGETEVEERFIKRNLGRWREITSRAYALLEANRPELIVVFNRNHPMSRVRINTAA